MFIKIFYYSIGRMKRAQFVSPIVILAVIIISSFIIMAKLEIERALSSSIASLSPIFNNITNITLQDLSFQNSLTHRVLALASSINSSGTIQDIVMAEYKAELAFYEQITANYSREYICGTSKMVINNTIAVPYPYIGFQSQEQRFDANQFRTCMGTSGCGNWIECINAFDSGTFDWQPAACLTSPLRIKVRLTDSRYPLTAVYPYFMWNNSFRVVE